MANPKPYLLQRILQSPFVKKFNWYFFSGILMFGSQFVLTSYLTKTQTEAAFSQYALMLSIVSPLFLFFNFDTRFLVLTKGDEYNRSTFLILKIIGLTIAGVLAGFIGSYRFEASALPLFLLLCGFRALDGLFELSYGYHLRQDKAKMIGTSQILRSIALLLAVAIGLCTSKHWTIFGVYQIVIVGILTVLFLFDWGISNRKRIPLTTNWDDFSTLLSFGLPLGIIVLLNSLTVQIPKYGLDWFDLDDLVGVFTALFVFVQTASFASFAIGNAIIPTIKRLFANRNINRINILILYTMGILVTIGIGFVLLIHLAGTWLVQTFYTAHYAEYIQELRILSWAAIPLMLSTLCSLVLIAIHEFKSYLLLTLCSTLVVVTLCYWLIPTYGLLGGISGFLIGQCVKTIMYYLRCNFILRKVRSS